jgi:hypothetical protein
MLDLIVDRREMKAAVCRALRFMRAEPEPAAAQPVPVGASAAAETPR